MLKALKCEFQESQLLAISQGGEGCVWFCFYILWFELRIKWKLNASIKIKVPEVHLQITCKNFLPV